MNKKAKRIVIIVGVIFIVAGVLFTIKIVNNTNKQTSEEVEIQVDPKAREKSDNALIEDTVRNFRGIYASLVNDKELDFSFLNNVITKDSEIYKKVVGDIEAKRSLDTKIEDQNVDIKEIKGATEGYEVVTTITYTETVKGKSEVIKSEQIFKVSVQDNNIKITELN